MYFDGSVEKWWSRSGYGNPELLVQFFVDRFLVNQAFQSVVDSILIAVGGVLLKLFEWCFSKDVHSLAVIFLFIQGNSCVSFICW